MLPKMTSIFSLLTSLFLPVLRQQLLPFPIPDFPYAEKEVEIPYAILSIPKIQLEKELYAKDDERNDLDTNIIFLPTSALPTEEKGNVILAGHSGFGNIAYFKKLYQLQKGDEIALTYLGNEYLYEVSRTYQVAKTGKVEVIRDPQKEAITLITCYGKKKQLVVIGERKK